LVPLDQAQLDRQLAIASANAVKNPPLPDNPVLSDRESRQYVWLDIARMIDACFGTRESVPLMVAAQSPLLMLLLLGFLLPRVWPFIVAFAVLIGGFRFWVWVTIERSRK
jgi:hypothetical protein